MKSGFYFLDEPVYAPKKGKKDKIVLKEDLRFYIYFAGQRLPELYVVPAGFESNGFTIPFIFKPFFSNFDVGVENAIAHDFLYSELRTFDMFRRDADMAFYSGLRSSSLEEWKAKAFYIAVLIWGGSKWRKKI
jgi:hypothetical protein